MNTTHAVLRWEDPPNPTGGARGKFNPHEVLKELRQEPGVWAVIATGISPTYSQTSKLVAELKEDHCEVSARKVDGTRCLYARYVPPMRGRNSKVA